MPDRVRVQAMKKKAISKIAQGKRAKLAVFKGSKETLQGEWQVV